MSLYYSCAAEDRRFTQSACNVVDSCVCERLSDEHIQTASLLQECIYSRWSHVPSFWLCSLERPAGSRHIYAIAGVFLS